MSKNILTNLDLNKNEIQNAVIQPLAVAPSNPALGQIYTNSADKVIYQWDGEKWKPVGVVYQQEGSTGAVIVGLDSAGNVTTKKVVELTLSDYTPVDGGYVSTGMTLEQAMNAMDTAIKNAVAGGGEVNQNAWSKLTVKKQSTAATAVAGASDDVTLSSTAKTDTFNIATGNKWVDVNGSGKTVTIGHSLSGVAAGVTGAADTVPVVTVDAAGHVTNVGSAKITPAAIGADTAGAAAAVLGTNSDDSAAETVFGARKLAQEAKEAAEAAQSGAGEKVASVGATENGGIEIKGTATAPTVGIKLDPAEGNAATLSAAGLKVTIPEVDVPEYSLTKDDASGNYAAVYHLTKDGANVGAAINIPKDLFVKEGKIVDNPSGQPAGKYIELTLQNQNEKIYINVADLVDAYTPGDGITISAENVVSAKVVAANGLSVGANGIAMAAASASSAGAMSSSHYSKLEGIDDGATANTITLNGTETKTPSFYAPTAAGTNGQILVSSGSGAPTWQNMPTHLKKYTQTNPALTASGGLFTWTIAQATHGITTPCTVQLYEVASGDMVIADVSVTTTAVTIKINGTGTLAANTYRAVIIG